MPDTPTRDGFTLGRLARDVLTVLDRFEVPRAHLVGNSLGGLIGFELAVTTPERVATITTFGTTAQLRSNAALVWTVRATLRVLGTRGTGWVAGRSVADREGGRVIARLMAEADRRAVGLVSRNIATYDDTPGLRHSRVPWLLIRGERDRGINRVLASTLAVINAREDAHLVDLDGAGHYANLEEPETFNAALDAFLKRYAATIGGT